MNNNENVDYQIQSTIALFSDGRIQEALALVGQLIRNYPRQSKLYNIEGACYASLREFDSALKSYKKAIRLNPVYAEAYNNIANTYRELKQVDNAIEFYKKAIDLKPTFSEPFNNLGNIYLLKKKLFNQFYLFESPKKLSKSTDFKEFSGLKILKKTYKNKLKLKSNFGNDKITLYKN